MRPIVVLGIILALAVLVLVAGFNSPVLTRFSYVMPSIASADEQRSTQLRIYTINRGKMDDFVAAWLAGVYPLRKKHGFEIERAWVNRERNEFIWIIGLAGEWEAAEGAYYGSAERASLDPDPAQYIAQSNEWFIESVPLDR